MRGGWVRSPPSHMQLLNTYCVLQGGAVEAAASAVRLGFKSHPEYDLRWIASLP